MEKRGGSSMGEYIEPIRLAIFIFPLIAFLFTLPYLFYQYHKYGSLLLRRAFIVYSFILYLTCAYFLVILPLPSLQSVENMKTPWVQLVPFDFVKDFFLKSSFILEDPSTYISVFKESYFYQVFYNILLTLPFGVYLRYYFKCSFVKTLFLSFLLTLFFEGTQLSGLYGIYPRPYRLFDIDDLFLNTLGGIIGFAITPLFCKFLPERQKLDELSYIKGQKISLLRRIFAITIDFFLVQILTTCFMTLGIDSILIQYVLSIIILFMVVPIWRGGFTFGKKWMNIKIVTMDGEKPKWYQYLIRYGILYLLLLPLPFYLSFIIFIFTTFTGNISFWIMMILTIFFAIFTFVHASYALITRTPFWYEKLSQTQNRSTIVLEEEK